MVFYSFYPLRKCDSCGRQPSDGFRRTWTRRTCMRRRELKRVAHNLFALQPGGHFSNIHDFFHVHSFDHVLVINVVIFISRKMTKMTKSEWGYYRKHGLSSVRLIHAQGFPIHRKPGSASLKGEGTGWVLFSLTDLKKCRTCFSPSARFHQSFSLTGDWLLQSQSGWIERAPVLSWTQSWWSKGCHENWVFEIWGRFLGPVVFGDY